MDKQFDAMMHKLQHGYTQEDIWLEVFGCVMVNNQCIDLSDGGQFHSVKLRKTFVLNDGVWGEKSQ